MRRGSDDGWVEWNEDQGARSRPTYRIQMPTANTMLARAIVGEIEALPAIHQSSMPKGDRKAMPSQIQMKR